ncbi:MAG TPA: hypothetical protein VNM92_16655 [Thermoanaerobaculia bacterium]|nr:hypothetical protein [Thermoanaerobaculia bacterium]
MRARGPFGMLNDLQIQRLRDSIQEGADLSRDEMSALVRELEEAHRNLSLLEKKEESYLGEIQRLNSVVAQLIEYIETIADIAGDASAAAVTSDEIKRRAIEMIIRSVNQVKETLPR